PAPVTYRAPVPGPVIDPFRPPANPYAPGNRGLDYRTRPGEPVVAAASGDVLFAGPVADRLVVVLLHADRLRSSYTGLRSIMVRRGQQLSAGQLIGTADERLQFGVRGGTAYLDPEALLHASRPTRAHPVRDHGP